MTVVRGVVGAVGVLLLGWGLVLVAGLGGQLLDVGTWLVGGIVLHDGVLAPLVLVAGALAAAVAPAWLRPSLVGLLVVLGPLTLVAVPVLGRFGARPDNPTLLDRPYAAGWLAVAGVALVVTAADALRRRSRTRVPQPGEDPETLP